MTRRDDECTGELLEVQSRVRDASRSHDRSLAVRTFQPQSTAHTRCVAILTKIAGMLTMDSLMIAQQACADLVEELYAGVRCVSSILMRQVIESRRLRRLQSYHNFLNLEPAKTRHPHALSRGETPIREPNIHTSS